MEGVGDKGGDVTPVCTVRLVWFTVPGWGSGCVSSHIGKLGEGGVAAVARLDNSISWSVANADDIPMTAAAAIQYNRPFNFRIGHLPPYK